MATNPARKPLVVKPASHFLLEVCPEHGGQTGGASRQSCVGGNSANAFEVHRGKRAAGIKAIPSEPENQSAAYGDGQIMRQHGCATVALEFASKPRTKNDRAGKRNKSADGVNDGGSSEIMEAHPKRRKNMAIASHRKPASHPVPKPNVR